MPDELFRLTEGLRPETPAARFRALADQAGSAADTLTQLRQRMVLTEEVETVAG